jgi:hypothetical protein
VDGVKLPRLFFGKPHHPHSDNLEMRVLQAADDMADDISLDSVRFDNQKRPAQCVFSPWCLILIKRQR